MCADCGTTKTPLWRGGPAGPKVNGPILLTLISDESSGRVNHLIEAISGSTPAVSVQCLRDQEQEEEAGDIERSSGEEVQEEQ